MGVEAYIGLSEVLCSPEALQPGTRVTFFIGGSAVKPRAIELILLADEHDPTVIGEALWSHVHVTADAALDAAQKLSVGSIEVANLANWISTYEPEDAPDHVFERLLQLSDAALAETSILPLWRRIRHFSMRVDSGCIAIDSPEFASQAQELLSALSDLDQTEGQSGLGSASRKRTSLDVRANTDVDQAWASVPGWLLSMDDYWLKAPKQRKLDALEAGELDMSKLSDDVVASLCDTITHAPDSFEANRAMSLIEAVNRSARWLEHVCALVAALPGYEDSGQRLTDQLPPEFQIELAWPELRKDAIPLWRRISDRGRLLLLYKSVYDSVELPLLYLIQAEEPGPVRSALVLIWARNHSSKKDSAVARAHAEFASYVSDQAWSGNAPLDVFGLLPSCRMSVVDHCEGRPWPTLGEDDLGRSETAFCPRAGKGCTTLLANPAINSKEPGLSGARLYPVTEIHWTRWSMLELLEWAGLEVTAPQLGLRSPQEYVPKLSGWVNRLNEIRSRLKCSACKSTMVPNYAYSKNLAKYNVTVASCPEGKGHDHNIYLNHCWACFELIDSRESRFQDAEGFYVCIQCGSGKPNSLTHTQGDLCPACGSKQMRQNRRSCTCTKCNHSIWLPPAHSITGPRAQERCSQF